MRVGGCSRNCVLTRGSAPRPRTLHPIPPLSTLPGRDRRVYDQRPETPSFRPHGRCTPKDMAAAKGPPMRLLLRLQQTLSSWMPTPNEREDSIRRNRSLLTLWKHCANEHNWESWSTLAQEWGDRFHSWALSHAETINLDSPLCFSALTGGWEDFLTNTCRISAAWGMNAFSSPTPTVLPPTPLPLESALSHRIFFRTDDITSPNFDRMNSLLTNECFFICVHNRLRSPDWSGWLQRCEDFDRGFCFLSANRLKTRTYCSSDRGTEQWSWAPGVWEFWLIRGGVRPLCTGINTRLFDGAISSFINHDRRWDHDAQCKPLSDFIPAEDGQTSVREDRQVDAPQNPRESRWLKLREFWATWDSESELRKRCFETSPIDWQGIVASCKRMAVCLLTCPDSRLRRPDCTIGKTPSRSGRE